MQLKSIRDLRVQGGVDLEVNIRFPSISVLTLLNLELSEFSKSSTTATSSEGLVSDCDKPTSQYGADCWVRGSRVALRWTYARYRQRTVESAVLTLSLLTCAERDAESDIFFYYDCDILVEVLKWTAM